MVVTTLAVFFASLSITGDSKTAVVIVATTDAVTDEVRCVSKKAIWASYMGEFLFILLPILWTLRG